MNRPKTSRSILLPALLFPLCLGAFPSGEQLSQEAQDTTEVPDYFEAFKPLVGKTWEAELSGGRLRDRQSFGWVYGGKFLRNEHAVTTLDGEVIYEGETIYAWDPREDTLVWWYWNSTGGYVTGQARAEGNRILAEGENHGGAGQTQRVQSIFELEDELWRSTSYFQVDGEFVEQSVATYSIRE